MTILFTVQKNVYLYFAVGLFLNKKTRIIDVLGVLFFFKLSNKSILTGGCNSGDKIFNIRKNQYSMIEVLSKISSILYFIIKYIL